jgi:hypothetical protein
MYFLLTCPLMAAASVRVVKSFDIGRSPDRIDGANDPPFLTIAGLHRAFNGYPRPVDNPALRLCVALPAFPACYDARIRFG